MDRVKTWNLDRSPIFIDEDVGRYKVEAARNFLANVGVTNIRAETCPFHEAECWATRQAGSPDVLISAANEKNVRYHTEAQYPPIQVYGTTGRNWQASLIRHLPLVEACSCCLFPEEIPRPAMSCATAPPEPGNNDQEQVDAALPFLSFSAGLMTAAEIMKSTLPGYPFTANRVTFTTQPIPRLVPSRLSYRENCICQDRNEAIHRKMLDGTMHAKLSGI